jgi:DNA repair protein RadC
MSASNHGSHPEGHRERLRLRSQSEPDALSEAELLELLLTYAIPRQDVSGLARFLLEKYGSISAVLVASEEEIRQVDGIGESKAIFIRVVHAAYLTE